MIAAPLVAPRRANTAPRRRSTRHATVARAKRTRRLRYRAIGQTIGALCVATFVVLLYLTLLANITRLNYEVSHAKGQRTQLWLQTAQNEDRIAQLESRDHLEPLAARLRMRDAETFAIVSLPPHPKASLHAPGAVALLSGVTGWLR